MQFFLKELKEFEEFKEFEENEYLCRLFFFRLVTSPPAPPHKGGGKMQRTVMPGRDKIF